MQDNPVNKVFWGRVYIEQATSFFFYTKDSIYRHMIHELKYGGDREVGVYLGELFGLDLKKSNFFNDIDYIVPVPLHPKRRKKRGYNQSEMIGNGLSNKMGVPVCFNNFYRIKYTETQTRKNKLERWENVNTAFDIKSPEKYYNKHLLLVDDVLTTGATLEACASKLLRCKGTRVSIATLGFSYDI